MYHIYFCRTNSKKRKSKRSRKSNKNFHTQVNWKNRQYKKTSMNSESNKKNKGVQIITNHEYKHPIAENIKNTSICKTLLATPLHHNKLHTYMCECK